MLRCLPTDASPMRNPSYLIRDSDIKDDDIKDDGTHKQLLRLSFFSLCSSLAASNVSKRVPTTPTCIEFPINRPKVLTEYLASQADRGLKPIKTNNSSGVNNRPKPMQKILEVVAKVGRHPSQVY